MKNAHKHWMVASLLAALGLAAGAQTPPPFGQPAPVLATQSGDKADPARMQERMARMQEQRAKRLAEFKQKLQLSPGQEGAWISYSEALNPSGPFQRGDRAELAKLSTPERIDRMRVRRTERIAEMDKRGEATKTFYAVLTPQQKKVFDDTTARTGAHRHGGHRGQHMS